MGALYAIADMLMCYVHPVLADCICLCLTMRLHTIKTACFQQGVSVPKSVTAVSNKQMPTVHFSQQLIETLSNTVCVSLVPVVYEGRSY